MRNRKLYVILVVIGLFLIIGAIIFNSLIDSNEINIDSSKHWTDVDYVGDEHIGHRMDIYLPVQKLDKYPVVITIYGSGWLSNYFKEDAFKKGVGQALLKAGYAVVAINHRASSEAIFPAQIHDVKAAIRFVRANAVTFSLDTNFIGITGWSSGGHLSSLAGASNNIDLFEFNGIRFDIEGKLGSFTNFSSHVDAVVNWFGPANFLLMDSCGSSINHNDENSPESLLLGGAIQLNKDACYLADPATYINLTTPPFLIIHGTKDSIVPICEGEYLSEKLLNKGINCKLIKVPDGEHGPGVFMPEYIQQMVLFFDKQRN